MKIPQTLDELRNLPPAEQQQVGEIFGRLMAFKPELLPSVTKIRQEELMALAKGEAPAGTTTTPSPSLTVLEKGMKTRAYQPDPDTLHVQDVKTHEKRPAEAGPLGVYDILVKNGEILKMGSRAREVLK
jgi:hypothetical protein